MNKVGLVLAPTPFHELPRLSNIAGVNVFAKRDDLTGLAGGGNKARKLEYIVHDALSAGADCLITVGAVQSNHARMTAAAAARYSLDCELVLEGEPPEVAVGNVLLDRILGANITYCKPDTANEVMDEVASKLVSQGRKPYKIPVGGSNAIGVLGYVQAMDELCRQISNLERAEIVCASGSGGTLAGIILGAHLYCPHIKVCGISVSRARKESEQRVWNLCCKAAEILKTAPPDRDKVVVYDDYVGQGYAVHTKEGLQAVKTTARTEGLLLDPVYTGKAMAGLLDRVDEWGPNVIFWHTGGSEALGAHPQLAEREQGDASS